MAARACGPCDVNWPSITPTFSRCPLCGESTTFVSNRSPDYTQEEAAEYVEAERERAQAEKGKPSPEHVNRVERYLALGFSAVDAELLALARRVHVDGIGRQWIRPVNHLDVARALAAGCSHALAVEIFA